MKITAVIFTIDGEGAEMDLYGYGDQIDSSKYVDFEYKVVGDSIKEIIRELEEVSRGTVRISIEGNPDKAELGELFTQLLLTEIDIFNSPN